MEKKRGIDFNIIQRDLTNEKREEPEHTILSLENKEEQM